MQINNTLSRWQLVPLVFAQDNVAAGQAAVALLVNETGAAAALANVGYTMPFAGEIVGVSANLSAAATIGTLAVLPTIATTVVSDPVLSITTETAKSDRCPRGKNVFAKDAVIGCKITTGGTWNGTGDDLVVIVWVLLRIDAI